MFRNILYTVLIVRQCFWIAQFLWITSMSLSRGSILATFIGMAQDSILATWIYGSLSVLVFLHWLGFIVGQVAVCKHPELN